MLRRHICKSRTGELDDIFSKLCKVDDKNIINSIQTILSKVLPSDKDFQAEFTIANIGDNTNRAKYILEVVEYYLMKDAGELSIKSGNDVHLEHIIPQKIKTKKSMIEFGDWITYLGENSEDKHKEYVNRIGNLTLLGQKLNITASNNPYERKLAEYKKSNFCLTKDICNNFKHNIKSIF
jgi:hypothetical protein